MEHFLTLIVNFVLLAQFAISHPTPFEITKGSELDILKANPSNDTLVFAHVIYRHGQRDTEGAKQLTNEGKRELYRSGQYFHRRYSKILGEKYSPDKVYIISTDKDRTIMSAQASLASFFVPKGEEVWQEGLLWQPVPVHTIARNEDSFIHFDRPCPKYDILYQYYSQQSPEVREIYAKYGHLFPYWSQMSGVEIISLESIAFLYKKLMTDAGQNKPIPDWAKKDLKKMEYIREVNYKIKSIPQLIRLKTGFLIKDIFDRFSQKIDGTLKPTNRTLWVYSGHSTTIKLLFNSLGLSSLSFPDYGCSLHWELYKTPENKYYIQLFYRKPNEENPSPLSLPGCGETYTLEHFRSVHNNIIPGDFDTECQASYKYDLDFSL